MSKSLFASLAATLALALALSGQNVSKKSGLDKATLEAYVRHLFVMDQRIKVEVADPKPSADLPGFYDVTIRASMGAQSQDIELMVSKDGSKILQGQVFDVATNPFKKDLDKIKTAFEPSMGTPGADVVMVEFSDFECPYCKEEAAMLRQNLLSAYPKQVRLYFKTFPIESLHPWAKPAAIAAKCVFRQTPTAFWDFHDWIFAHQTDISADNVKDKVIDWAKGQKDIDAVQLGQCMDTKATEAEVDKDLAEGRGLQVDRTPTIFVNGRRINSAIDWPSLRSIIDNEIEYQKTAKNAGENCGCDTQLSLPGMPQTNKTFSPLKK